MARKRKRDWQIVNYSYDITSATVPEAAFVVARRMSDLWGLLCDEHQRVRTLINDQTAEDDRKKMWAEFNVFAREAVKASGLNWVNGPEVLDRFTKACVAVAKDSTRGWPSRGRFRVSLTHRWTGGGSDIATITSRQTNRLRISGNILCEPKWLEKRETLRSGEGSGVFEVDGKTGECIAFRFYIHRPMPSNAILKAARWTGKYTPSFGWKWRLTMTVEIPPTGEEREPSGKRCAIDLGWRKRPHGIRYAYLVDSDDASRELVLSTDFSTSSTRRSRRAITDPNWLHPPTSHDELRDWMEMRDRNLEEVKAKLRTLLSPLPDGFVKMRRGGLWKLMNELPDGEAKSVIAAWHEPDTRLMKVQARQQERMARCRDDQYRKMAVTIAKAYDEVRIDAAGLKQMIDDDKKDPALKAADRNRDIAAPGLFAQHLKNACKKYGAKCIVVEPNKTTATCSVCGAAIAPGPSLVLRCENGHAMDQDENACRVMLSQTWAALERKPRLRKKAERSVEAITENCENPDEVAVTRSP